MKNLTKIRTTHYSMFLVSIALLLVAVFIGIGCLERPVMAKAASNKQYISEIRILAPGKNDYGAEAKKLTNKGYKIDTASNLLQGCSDDTMYLAYKTTSDPKKALTDFSLMNMNGPYSFAGYEDLIEDTKLFAQERISYMSRGIEEFRKNYKAEAPSAKYAYEMMNRFREDDSGKLVGDFILGISGYNNNALRDMVMQADPIILSTIDKGLAIGSAPVGEEKSWIEKLSELNEYDIEDARLDPTLEKKAQILMDSIIPIAQKLKTYNEFYTVVDKEFSAESEEKLKEMIADPVIKQRFDDLVKNYYGDDDAHDFEAISLMYLMLASNKYENDPALEFEGKKSFVKPKEIQNGSVLDLVLRVLDEENFDFPDLYPMASVLSDVQADMMYIAGFETSVMLCDNDNQMWDDTKKIVDESEIGGKKVNEFEIISVYSGVDRTIYNPDGIALSDDASRRQCIDPEDTWYANNLDETTEWILRGVIGVSATAIVGMSIRLGVKLYKGAFQPSMIATGDAGLGVSEILEVLDDFDDLGGGPVDDIAMANQAQYAKANNVAKCKDIALSKKWSINTSSITGLFKVAFAVVMFVFIAALTTYLVWELIEYYKEPVYTEKPRIIFHNFFNNKGKSIYVRYDAVVNQDGEMTDVRNATSKQWVVLYTSRDPNAGNPILADSIKISYSKSENMSKYDPVHRIGESNTYNLQDGDNCLVYFKRDANAYPRTAASSFSAGAFTLALCGGIIGGGLLGWLTTWFIMKRKNKPVKDVETTTSN